MPLLSSISSVVVTMQCVITGDKERSSTYFQRRCCSLLPLRRSSFFPHRLMYFSDRAGVSIQEGHPSELCIDKDLLHDDTAKKRISLVLLLFLQKELSQPECEHWRERAYLSSRSRLPVDSMVPVLQHLFASPR